MSAGFGTYGGRSYGATEGPSEGGPIPTGSEHSILRSGVARGGRMRTRVNIWELIFVPWVFLDIILLCYLLAGANGKVAVLWIIPIVLLGLSLAFVNWHYKAGNNAEVMLGFLCITAVLIGLVVGVYAEVKSLSEYHRLSLGASYYNVLPSEPAAGHSDGTTFVFTNLSTVDQSHVFGYTDAYSSSATQYCVAPIANGDQGVNQKVQFWAAGTNCCESRSNFQCGEANDVEAHGALVQPSDVQMNSGFKNAITGAESAFELKAAEKYLLLTWTADPTGYRDGLWSSTLALFLIFSGVYFFISAMIGCSLMPVIIMK